VTIAVALGMEEVVENEAKAVTAFISITPFIGS
jgi:hypothetical protein